MQSVDTDRNSAQKTPAESRPQRGLLKRVWQRLSTSYAVWALIALVGAELVFQKLPFDHYASANRSMVWWAVKDFRQQKTCPDVVLLGSSLLMNVLHGGDAEFLKLPQNEVYHHKAFLLEDLLRKHTGVKINSFAFAIAGTMASDAYALSATLFAGEKKPKVIIYSIAPRDLIDNTLGSPASTDTFRLMSRLGGVKDIDWQARSGSWERIEYLCECVSSLYRQRNYFVYLQQCCAKNFLQTTGYKDTDEVHTHFALRRLSLLQLPEDFGSNERIFEPGTSGHYSDNSLEYIQRYRPFKPTEFKAQCRYLEKFFSFCEQRGIEVVLVNMPLTADNLKLLTPGAYALYKQKVCALSEKYHGRFIDMQDTKRFDKSLYCDTAHMNGAGGVKFFETLAERLTDGTSLAIGKNAAWN